MALHTALVRTVLRRLIDHELYVKLPKCEFHRDQVDFLGSRISGRGVEMDPGKVQAVIDWPAPRTRRHLQSFLGFANFYRDFIPDFASIALPLTDLLRTKGARPGGGRPGAPINWSPACQMAFQTLKAAFTTEPVLVHADPNKQFIVHVDTSNVAMGLPYYREGRMGNSMPALSCLASSPGPN
ncbi:uncharacterized mitochondrial protein AtMg00860-like [Sphaerodactylus townsendi]|uniref:uncharacterized mitochondrial protein AtMg00860-like n=1 Tax=Sphaerodactylus townsendi TaxID=933632 RepID=UPI0020269166|nr:uncharacterized mitochondrial protein AtMg00860-like [Sphaerodactylus townsendi]